MKQLFFQKGQKQEFSPNGEYLLQTSNNLDSKKYILQKIPYDIFSKQNNYIENHFYFSRQDNLISYFNCWRETETVQMQKPITKEKQKKKDKRTMLDVMKRKTLKEIQHTIAPSKKKIVEQQKNPNDNLITQDFIYVQMEYFSEIEIPTDFIGTRDLMVVIYLLARRVQKKTGCIPCMIPVKNQENDRIKFFKKGISLQVELYKLMIYLFKDKQQAYLKQWSQMLQKSIHKALINHDEHLIGSLLKFAIQQFLSKPLSICLIKQDEKVCSVETVRIIDCDTLLLQESQIQMPIDEYTISYLLKSQNDREITLTHQVFQQYTLAGKKNNLIVKWLFHMAT